MGRAHTLSRKYSAYHILENSVVLWSHKNGSNYIIYITIEFVSKVSKFQLLIYDGFDFIRGGKVQRVNKKEPTRAPQYLQHLSAVSFYFAEKVKFDLE